MIKKFLKKAISTVLASIICVTMLVECFNKPILCLAEQSVEENKNIADLETIKSEFIRFFSNISKNRSNQNGISEISVNEFYSEYADDLAQLGYQMNIVYKNNYNEKQEELNTNFQRLGIDEEGVYLILLENNNTRNTGYGYTDYTYNGRTYRLRKVMITAAENSAFSKASYCDLLKSNSRTVIENCLNTAIVAYVSSISKTMGTVASICGLNISMFGTAGSSSLILNCGTNWTRIYTEVYSEYYNEWVAGSCVENAKVSSYVSGYYYSASTNSMEAVPENKKEAYILSQNYDNTTWKKQQAIISYNNCSGVIYDQTGDIKYYYGDKVKITHRENF